MKGKGVVGAILAIGLLISLITSGADNQTSDTKSNFAEAYKNSSKIESTKSPHVEKKVTCDGIVETKNCEFEGVKYSTYVYHQAVPEKSHQEQTTTYRQEITSYCTLCNDGTYSPSCATGRGACSHHGGVAQWNAPRYSQVPIVETKTVIDEPAKEAYIEKIAG